MVRVLSIAAMGTALMFAACTSGPSWDQPGRTTSANKPGDMNSLSGSNTNNGATEQDREFVTGAAAGGAYEIQSSQIALQKTNSPRVRMIAQHMVHDHTEAGQQLMAIAQKEGVSATDSPNADQQQMIAKLNRLNGESFDDEYVTQQKAAHEQVIALFKKESADGSDAAIRGFAVNNLGLMQAHYRMVTTGDNMMDK